MKEYIVDIGIFSMKVATTTLASAGAASVSIAGGHVAGVLLLFLSGICAVSGALFFSAKSGEIALKDTIATILFPFLLGIALGPYIGSILIKYIPGGNLEYATIITHHMFGGLMLGVFATPVMRLLLDKVKKYANGEKK